MYCPQCGRTYEEKANFCCHCGAALSTPSPHRKLTRSRRNKKIAGVCGGFAEYLELDATLVRLAWIMLALFVGWGVIGYLIAWIILPDEPLPQLGSVPSALSHPAPQP
jgi:phage shock protein C